MYLTFDIHAATAKTRFAMPDPGGGDDPPKDDDNGNGGIYTGG